MEYEIGIQKMESGTPSINYFRQHSDVVRLPANLPPTEEGRILIEEAKGLLLKLNAKQISLKLTTE